jgi:GNAT superfamily N-acetyltransferase
MSPRSGSTGLAVRRDFRTSDREPVHTLLDGTGFFNTEELAVAMELVDDRLAHGGASHYRFLVAELDGAIVGYACWGPILGTAESADLYWIAVDRSTQGKGVGRALLAEAERWIAGEDRTRVYLETAGRAQYQPTRTFYLACGYRIVAELEHFYAPGDAKVIFLRVLEPAG